MGNDIKCTDLSWQMPGPRADIDDADLPLNDMPPDDMSWFFETTGNPWAPAAPGD
jgi:hypothetical protein